MPKQQRHSPPLHGPSLEGGLYPGLPQGEAGSCRRTAKRLKRVTLPKQQRHSPPLHGPSLEGGLYPGLPQGEAGSCRAADRRLKRVSSLAFPLRDASTKQDQYVGLTPCNASPCGTRQPNRCRPIPNKVQSFRRPDNMPPGYCGVQPSSFPSHIIPSVCQSQQFLDKTHQPPYNEP